LATVLILIPELDFDPTEVAVSWKVLSALGHDVQFATPEAHVARGDELSSPRCSIVQLRDDAQAAPRAQRPGSPWQTASTLWPSGSSRNAP
jgi:putative intracellular protease/amidase